MKKVTAIKKADRKALGLSKDQCRNLQRLRNVLFDKKPELLTAKQFTALQDLSYQGLIIFNVKSPDVPLFESVDVRFTETGGDCIARLVDLKLWPNLTCVPVSE